MKPYVTVSYAQSLDGRIATITGDSQWISGKAALKLAHRLRRANDAILVGIGTVLRDDPLLTCRIGRCSPLIRVVLDSALRIPLDSRIAETAGSHRTVLFTSERTYGSSSRTASLRKLGLEILPVPEYREKLDIAAVLHRLAEEGVRKLYVEGGGKVISEFVRRELVHRMLVVTAPVFIGDGVSALEDLGVRELAGAVRPKVRRVRRFGGDFVWDLRFET
jgi:riboflavin-specific deaminase-like protein